MRNSILFILMLLTILACKEQSKGDTADNASEAQTENPQNPTVTPANESVMIDFSGKFSYSENLGASAGGTPINYFHSLEITKTSEKTYEVKYNIDGYQMMQRLVCSAQSQSNGAKLLISFVKFGEDALFANEDLFKSGQQLMEIESVNGKTNEIKVTYANDYPYDDKAGKTITFQKSN